MLAAFASEYLVQPALWRMPRVKAPVKVPLETPEKRPDWLLALNRHPTVVICLRLMFPRANGFPWGVAKW